MDYLSGIMIRTATDRDGDALLAMVSQVYLEYPGCQVDEETELPELKAPATVARQTSGRWWVAELDGDVVGSVAVKPSSASSVELKKLYVARTARRAGLGAQLVKLAENEALARRSSNMFLWTDVRFLDAHRLYERLGYIRAPGTRALRDASDTVEYRYAKELGR
ncbi:MAG: GNAT family N-acetyltransferase [Proteobacteria bacterium]|nr:GNAT family N-acetyltransferase [Pseudomonadota bacterium]